jgi:hypothetical protein
VGREREGRGGERGCTYGKNGKTTWTTMGRLIGEDEVRWSREKIVDWQ